MKKNHSLLFLAVALLASNGTRSSAFAAEAYDLPEVVVTATKTLNSIADAGGSSVTVITEEEIRNSGKSTVIEVIQSVPGINVSANGGIGSVSSVFMRGADSKNTLVLIDGISANDPTSTNRNANFSDFTVDNIERIEVVRGPVSVLYGSNATAGVINIITKKGGKTSHGYVGVDGGAYSTWKTYAGASGSRGSVNYSVNLSRFKTDGFSAVDEDNRCVNTSGKTYEKDGYENTTFSAGIDAKFSDSVKLESSLRYQNASLEYDSSMSDASASTGNTSDSEQINAHIALKVDYQPVLSNFYFNLSDHARVLKTPGSPTGSYRGSLYDLGWQGDITISTSNTLTAGVGYQQEYFEESYSIPIDKSVDTMSAFLQDQWAIGGFRLIGGLRYDDNELFGDKVSYRFAPSYKFGDTVMKCSYGTGFRAPSLYELYGQSSWNNQLKPETSKGWDAGFEHTLAGNLKLGTTYFRTDYEELIEYKDWTSGYAQSSGTTETKGVETFVEWQPVSSAFVGLSHTYTYTRNARGNELVRRPRNKVAMNCSWNASKALRFNANMQWVGSRVETGAKDDNCVVTNKLDSYFLVDISSSYKVSNNVELYGRIDNLFDEYYEVAWGYATSGRAAYAGIKYTF